MRLWWRASPRRSASAAQPYGPPSGAGALRANTFGYQNTASGVTALGSNTTGIYNTASGFAALYLNDSGTANAAYGIGALYSNTTDSKIAALGHDAGYNATTGSYNVFLGAGVTGTAAGTNTIRIGLPYSGGTGQNRTFIAGIRGTQLTGDVLQVFIDANGELGTLNPPQVLKGTGTISASQLQQLQTTVEELQQQVRDQQTMNADLRARLAKLEALSAPGAAGK